jgi:hypothetical protein
LLLLAIFACVSPVTDLSPEDLPSETPAGSSPTATVQWFPPTSTPTTVVLETPTATPILYPGIGGILTTDDFADAAGWDTRVGSGSSAIIDGGRITISIHERGLAVTSLQTGPGQYADFYAELTANISLCRTTDEYGLLVRAQSYSDYYRLVLSCDRTVRLERIRGGGKVILVPSTPSADVPFGSPGQVTIGVWTSGPEMRFFLNNHLQFSVIDPLFGFGKLGVYARSDNQTALTVSFSNLTVRSVEYASPTPTVTPRDTPRPSRTPRP